jgi:hypothetical protein
MTFFPKTVSMRKHEPVTLPAAPRHVTFIIAELLCTGLVDPATPYEFRIILSSIIVILPDNLEKGKSEAGPQPAWPVRVPDLLDTSGTMSLHP